MNDGSIISGKMANRVLERNVNTGSAEMNKICFMVFRMISMKVDKSDDFERKRKGLSPRPANDTIPWHFEYITQGVYKNEKLFCPHIVDFSVWISNESNAGTDFGDLEVYFDFVIEGLCMLEDLIPTESNGWITKRETNIVHSIIAAAVVQKGFVVSILNPRHALHLFVTVLRSYVDWNGPLEHAWHEVIFTLYTALMVGIDLTEKTYNSPIDPIQLLPLYPIAERILQQFLLIYPVTILEEFNHRHISTTSTTTTTTTATAAAATASNLEEECREFCDWLTNKRRGFVHLFLTLAHSMRLFPDLDASPLLPIAYHYKTEIDKFFSRNESLSSSELLADVRFFASRLEYIISIAAPTNQPRQKWTLFADS